MLGVHAGACALIGVLCTGAGAQTALPPDPGSAAGSATVTPPQTPATKTNATKIAIDHAAVSRLRSQFGSTISVIHTDHFRVGFTAGRVFVDHRAELFEQTYAKFDRFFRERGFQLTAPAKHMEVVLFATGGEFDAFARDVSRIGGDRVIVDYGGGRTRERSKHELMVEATRLERELRQAKTNLRQHYSGTNAATTIHECVHQLTYNTGLLDPHADTPHWLGEGLATLCESSLQDEIGEASEINPERFAVYRGARRSERLIPLKDLLTTDGYFLSENHAQAYAQSWSMVQFLVHREPSALRKYLSIIRKRRVEEGTKIDAAQRLKEFQTAFGDDLAAFAQRLSAYMDALR